jgi:hypothetical protein
VAASHTLVIEQGATLTRTFLWCNPVEGSDPPEPDLLNPISVVGYTARLQIRRRVTDADALLTLTTDSNGGITIVGAAGTVSITLTAAQTTALDFATGVWDLELISPAPASVVTRLIGGRAVLSREVTR